MYEELKKLLEAKAAAHWEYIDGLEIGQLLALIAESERLECMLENYKIDAKIYKDSAGQLKAENDELIAALNEILRVTPMGVEAFGIAALVLGELGVTKDDEQ